MDDELHHSFQFFPAPAELAGYLNSFYLLTVGPRGLNEMLPAYSGQLMLSAEGRGAIDFGDGLTDTPGDVFLTGPLSSAVPFAIDGPSLIFGASFTFHGWAALTGLPVVQSSDRFVTAQEALGEDCSAAALELVAEFRDGELEVEEVLDRLGEILAGLLEPLNPRHAELVETTYDWLSSSLSPDPHTLYEQMPMSERQVQRLVKRFFGLPPSRLKRRYRAIRAATLLGDPDLGPEKRSEIIDQFYDQAHMIREIREFTGRTPRLLSSESDSMVSRTLGAEGYGVVRLFGGEEDEQLGSK